MKTQRFLSLISEPRRLAEYLDMLHVLVVALDRRGTIQYVNGPAARLLGWHKEELLGRNWFETALPPQERDQTRRVFDSVMAGRLHLHERHENHVLCSGGETRLIDWHNRLLLDADDNPVGTLSSGRDITEERRLHTELENAAREWNATFEALPDGICVLDGQQHLQRCNRTMERWFPTAGAIQTAGVHCYQVVHQTTAPVPECPFMRMKTSLQRESSEILINGRWYEVTVDPIFDSMGVLEGAVHFMRDITERKLAEEERSALEEQFLQAQKMEAVGRMAGGIAHDFNNMLTVIIGYAESVLARHDLPDGVAEDIAEIRNAARRSAELTKGLLTFSKHHMVRPKLLDLRAVIDDLKNMMERVLGEEIELTISADPDLWPVRMDPIQIDQVVTNLLVNAHDAMPEGGRIVLELRNIVFDQDYAAKKLDCRIGDHVMLAVSDTGLGMDSETLRHALEPFYTTKDPAQGTGLGLSTVYGIAARYGGTVHLYSEPGMGTTVKVYFPRADQPDAPVRTPGSDSWTRIGGNETILLVEDDASIRSLARTMAEKLGYRIIEAANGPEALALAAEHEGPIHLLLTDVVMPRMSGPELHREFEKLRPETKILYMSGHTATMVSRYGYLDKRFPFLPKPFSLRLLGDKIRLALDRDQTDLK